MALVFVLYALFASVFTISKTGLQYAEPLFFVGSRMALAGLLLLSWKGITDPKSLVLNKRDWLLVLMLALFNIHLTNAFEFWGLQHLPSYKACFFYSLSPFMSALIAYLFLNEKLSAKKWMGLLVAFVGMMPMILAQTEEEQLAGQLWVFSWAELSILVAAFSSVFGWILLKKVVGDRGHSPLIANGYSMLIGGATALTHSYAVENWNPMPYTELLPFVSATMLLIVVSNLLSYNLYGYLLKRFSATFMSLAGFVCPLFAAFFGWFFLKEEISMAFYFSAAAILAGLSIFYSEEVVQLKVANVD